MDKVEASVIIPNWNGKDLLKVCLKSLRGQTFKSFEVIIVDNGSKDGSLEFMKRYPEVRVVALDKNYGFAKAVNEGIKKSRGKYVLITNNDIEMDKNCILNLIKTAKSKKGIGFIAVKMINFYNRKLVDSAGDYIDAVGHANNIGMGEYSEDFEVGREIFLGTGGGILIKKDLFDKVGYLDEDYFMYMEDVDWCFRAQLLGFRGWFEPKAKIYHIHKASSKKVPSRTEYLQFRNMTQTIIKDFPSGLLLYQLNWLRILLVNINTIRFLSNEGYFKEALKAELYILFHLPALLLKRNMIQKRKKVSDQYIINNVREKKITFFGLIPQGV